METSTLNLKIDTGKNPLIFMISASEGNDRRCFIPEPSTAKEKITIWQKQILIPFSLSNKLLAFLGPFLTAKSQPGKVKDLFSCYPIAMPYMFEEFSLDLIFMETPKRVFRYAPSTQNK